MGWRLVRKMGLPMIWKFFLERVASRTVRFEELVIRMTMRLEAAGSQYDQTHWVLDRERLGYMVCYSEPRRVYREHRAQLRQDQYHRPHPVGEVSSHGVLWVRELPVQRGCTRGA